MTDEVIIDAPSLVTPLLLKRTTNLPPQNKIPSTNNKTIESYIKATAVASLIHSTTPLDPILTINDYYKTSAAQALYNIGFNQVAEFNLGHKIKRLSKSIRGRNKRENIETDIKELEESRKERDKLKDLNRAFRKTKTYGCHHCPFKSESLLVLDSHLEIPHIHRKEYLCNWCDFRSKDIHQTAIHNLVQHRKRCRLEKPLAPFQCRLCSYECNSKREMTAHSHRCELLFCPNSLQGPQDFEKDGYPGVTPKLITNDDIVAYENTLKNLRLAAYNPHQITISGSNPAGVRPILVVARPPAPSTSGTSTTQMNPFECFVNKSNNDTRVLTNGQTPKNPLIPPVKQVVTNQVHMANTNQGFDNPILLNILSAQHLPVGQANSNSLQSPRTQSPFVNGKSVLQNASEIVMTPKTVPQAPKKDIPVITIDDDDQDDADQEQTESPDQSKEATFVICEICDSYIQDLSELKVHMQWIHKVRLHHKMLAAKPPLNCQKCQWKFFTDQGLERHLLGAHGLVTSNMQEQVDQGTDSGRCTVCGRAFASNLVAHMKDIHRSSLKPAHLSYKCTVCSATFNLYRLFENHVYSVHSDSVRRVSSK